MMRQVPSLIALTMGAWLLAMPAAAQDGEEEETEPSAEVAQFPRSRGAHRLVGCEDRELSNCLDTRVSKFVKAARLRAGAKKHKTKNAFDKFAYLAGMFSGRVDSMSIGNFRVRVDLTIK